MELELQYDFVTFETRPMDNGAETVTEGSLTLPKGAPDIEQVLQVQVKPSLTKTDVKDDQVVLEGACDVRLIYAYTEERLQPHADEKDDTKPDSDSGAEDEQDEAQAVREQRLHRVRWEKELPFAVVVDLPGVQEGNDIRRSIRLEGYSYDVSSGGTALDVHVALEVRTWTDALQTATLVTGVNASGDDVNVETKEIRLCNATGSGQKDIHIQGALDLSDYPPLHHAVELEAEATITDVVSEDDRVRVQGHVDIGLLYTDGEGAGAQYARWPRGIAFEAELEAQGARRGDEAHVDVTLGESRFQVVERDDSAAALDVSIPATLVTRVTRVKRVPLVTEITSEKREIAARTEEQRLVEAVGEGRVTEIVDMSLDVPEGDPDVERVLTGTARVVTEDVHVLGDRVVVEVQADVEMMYVGRDDQGGFVHVSKWPKATSMDIEIPVAGAEPGLDRTVDVHVRRLEWDPINRRAVDVRLELEASASLQREVDVESVQEAVAVPQDEGDVPTYTFVIVQPGDTLWKIAARYRSTEEEILSVNIALEEQGDKLLEGRKLCVPRKKETAEQGA